jgi:Kef-type K+ transport system membrane component KefB
MQIDLGTLVVIVALAAAAPLIVDVVPRIVLPVVVVEILLGIVVGPPILGWIHVTGLAQVLADFGLAFLFFLAGFELDLDQLRGMPARLALTGWGVSVAVALVVAGLLEALDVVESTLFVGVALTTTALGTLAPILRDNGDAEGRFGALVAAAGACGEVGPIILISLLLSETSSRGVSALLLVVFGLVTGVAAFAAPRLKPVRILQVLEQTMERTGQFAVRLALLILISLVYLTYRLHLDLVLGAFAAGLVASIACGPRAKRLMQPRLDAVGFGVFIPIFFIVTGMQFDLNAITSSVSGMLKLPLFVAMFLVARGLPTLFIYRYALGIRDRVALGLYASTALPLVVAVTSLGVKDGQMRASTAAGLVGAAMVSVMVFPLSANAIRRRGAPRTMRRS